jgi:hypothetical protein
MLNAMHAGEQLYFRVLTFPKSATVHMRRNVTRPSPYPLLILRHFDKIRFSIFEKYRRKQKITLKPPNNHAEIHSSAMGEVPLRVTRATIKF